MLVGAGAGAGAKAVEVLAGGTVEEELEQAVALEL